MTDSTSVATPASSPVVALILAGGSGNRCGTHLPKQFLEVCGETILHHTLSAFQGIADHILVVCRDEWQHYAHPHLTAPAGATGFESLRNGVAALHAFPDASLIMIHDAVRPLVTPEVLTANLAVARQFGNAITSVETYETLLYTPMADGRVTTTTGREGMWRAQTPQTFTLGTLRAMMAEAKQRCISDAQSACILASQLGYQLHISPGDFRNFKITTPSDLALYETLIP